MNTYVYTVGSYEEMSVTFCETSLDVATVRAWLPILHGYDAELLGYTSRTFHPEDGQHVESGLDFKLHLGTYFHRKTWIDTDQTLHEPIEGTLHASVHGVPNYQRIDAERAKE